MRLWGGRFHGTSPTPSSAGRMCGFRKTRGDNHKTSAISGGDAANYDEINATRTRGSRINAIRGPENVFTLGDDALLHSAPPSLVPYEVLLCFQDVVLLPLDEALHEPPVEVSPVRGVVPAQAHAQARDVVLGVEAAAVHSQEVHERTFRGPLARLAAAVLPGVLLLDALHLYAVHLLLPGLPEPQVAAVHYGQQVWASRRLWPVLGSCGPLHYAFAPPHSGCRLVVRLRHYG